MANAAQSLRWNAQLNRLWSPERRDTPNAFVRQTADDIVAAVPNPDVIYAFSWWRLAEGEALVIELDPPDTPYWALQLCDRWFQCFPDRRSNLNDRQVVPEADGTVRLVISDGDPGHPELARHERAPPRRDVLPVAPRRPRADAHLPGRAGGRARRPLIRGT